MDAKRVNVKVFAESGARVAQKELIPVFHGWIQRGVIKDELLIDVTDYEHVVNGPGVMLIGHESQYGLDESKGRLGLLYSQRRARVDGGFEQALRYSLRQALHACSLLQKEEALGGRLKFNAQELLVRINDRLLAPNTPETWKAVEAPARKVLSALLGEVSIEPAPPSLELFTLHVRAAKPVDVDTVLGRWPN
jgi:hypothetical protein